MALTPWFKAILFLVCTVGLHCAWGKAFDATHDAPQPADLTPYLSVLVDETGTLRAEELSNTKMQGRFVAADSSKGDLRFGYTNAVVWLQLDVANPTARAIERVLEINYAPVTTVDLYTFDEGKLVHLAQAGSARPFQAREITHRNPAFRLLIPATAEVRYVIRLSSTSSLIVPARLWAPAAFSAHARSDYVFHAAYLGMVAAILVFNLLIALRLREQVYLWYALTVGLFGLAIWTQLGMSHQFFWPGAGGWPDVLNYVFFSLSLAAMSQFLRFILSTRSSAPRSDAVLRGAGVFLLCSAFVLPATLPGTARLGVIVYMFFAALVLVVVGLRAVSGSRTARIVLAAYAALILSGITTTLRGLGLVPTNFLTVHGLQLGSTLEMMLLAFALAERFISLRDEATKALAAQAASRQAALSAQAELIEVLQRSERELEAKVRARTDELQALNHRLEQQSHTDALTGLANRRRFDVVFADEFSRASRSKQPLSVAMVDVDWFKNYNDSYGHGAGDECLRRAAAVFSQVAARAGDLVARYGGEEFAIVMPNTDREAAMQVASRLCTGVSELGLPHVGSPLGYVTVSVGVASTVPKEGMNSLHLVHFADQALYASKGNGRSRATHAEEAAAHKVDA